LRRQKIKLQRKVFLLHKIQLEKLIVKMTLISNETYLNLKMKQEEKKGKH
jgi:hypothetical protein